MKNQKISKSLKAHHKHKRVMNDVKKVIKFMLIFVLVMQAYYTFKPLKLAEAEQRNNFLPVNKDKENLTVVDKIIIEARKAGINEQKAVAIAHCESRFNPKARSSISSATGVYQFIARTWFDYCDGDVKNEDDNIKCFMKLYKQFPSWWECNKLI